jgi:hypothetical protein
MSKLKTTDRMSNTGFNLNGRPNWWARVGTGNAAKWVSIPYTRGDDYLECEVDLPVGTEVFCGAGKGSRKTVRQTVITS